MFSIGLFMTSNTARNCWLQGWDTTMNANKILCTYTDHACCPYSTKSISLFILYIIFTYIIHTKATFRLILVKIFSTVYRVQSNRIEKSIINNNFIRRRHFGFIPRRTNHRVLLHTRVAVYYVHVSYIILWLCNIVNYSRRKNIELISLSKLLIKHDVLF